MANTVILSCAEEGNKLECARIIVQKRKQDRMLLRYCLKYNCLKLKNILSLLEFRLLFKHENAY